MVFNQVYWILLNFRSVHYWVINYFLWKQKKINLVFHFWIWTVHTRTFKVFSFTTNPRSHRQVKSNWYIFKNYRDFGRAQIGYGLGILYAWNSDENYNDNFQSSARLFWKCAWRVISCVPVIWEQISADECRWVQSFMIKRLSIS